MICIYDMYYTYEHGIFANLSESGRSLRFSLMVWHVVMQNVDTYCDADALEDVWHAAVAT